MQVTDIRLRKIQGNPVVKGVASVTFDNAFVVHDIKVLESKDGMFIGMPSRKDEDGNFHDVAHPLNGMFREYVSKMIIDEYKRKARSCKYEDSSKRGK